MSLIIPAARTQTVEGEVAGIKAITALIYRSMKMQHAQAFNRVWNNPNFTPAEIITAFGPDALALFRLSGGIQNILAGADPEYARLVPPVDFTVNDDGTVTVAAAAV